MRKDRQDGAPAEQGGIVVLSPHFDDAVLACGAFLAGRPGATVLTVCAGLPPPEMPAPDWDRRCGFHSARQAVLARIDENRQALGLLRAVGRQLAMLDSQYGGQCEGLSPRLARELAEMRPALVLMPLGLFHDDHIRVSNAALRVRRWLGPGMSWVAYEDASIAAARAWCSGAWPRCATGACGPRPGSRWPPTCRSNGARSAPTPASSARWA